VSRQRTFTGKELIAALVGRGLLAKILRDVKLGVEDLD